MKPFYLSFSALLVIFSFSNCANGKHLQEEPPKAVQQAYYTTWTGGVKAAGSGFNLVYSRSCRCRDQNGYGLLPR